MTNKEKIIKAIEVFSNKSSLSDIIFTLSNMLLNDEEFSILVEKIILLYTKKFFSLNHKKNICEQQLIQTQMYLKGEMYKDEKTAKEMLYKQIENISEVLEK